MLPVEAFHEIIRFSGAATFMDNFVGKSTGKEAFEEGVETNGIANGKSEMNGNHGNIREFRGEIEHMGTSDIANERIDLLHEGIQTEASSANQDKDSILIRRSRNDWMNEFFFHHTYEAWCTILISTFETLTLNISRVI